LTYQSTAARLTAVVLVAPTITSAAAASGTVGQAFTYQITATGTAPITYTATTLPTGLSLSGDTISGTPTQKGSLNVTLTATNAGGSNTLAIVITIAGTSGGTNTAPTLTSNPSATPNPANVGQAVSFTAAATDAENDLLSYAWDFGDGATGAGASVSHTYTVAGVYTAKVTVSDSIGTDTGLVNVAVSGTSSPTSTDVLKVALKFNFVTTGKDSITMAGTLVLPDGFQPAGKVASVNIGGFEQEYTLNEKGQSTPKGFKLIGRFKDGTLVGTAAKFTFSLKGDLFADFEDSGFTMDEGEDTIDLPVVIQVGEASMIDIVTVNYVVKAAKGVPKTGAAKN
jgi:PKD repeat protein